MRLVIILLLISVLPAFVTALGVSPATTYLVEPENEEKTLRIINNEQQDLTIEFVVSESLEDYVFVEEETLFVSAGNEEHVTFTVEVPKETPPGLYEGGIIVQAVSRPGSATVSATAAVQHSVRINMPGDEAVVTGELHVALLAKDKPTFASVILENYGRKTAENVDVSLLIRTPDQQELVFENEQIAIEGLATQRVTFPWTPTQLGEHTLTAVLIVDGEQETIPSWYTVGVFDVQIEEPIIEQGKIGDLLQFDIPVENTWNNYLHAAYATVTVLHEGEFVETFVTPSKDLRPTSKETFTGYWNTKNLAAGTYTLRTTVFFADETRTHTTTQTLGETKTSIDFGVVAWKVGIAVLLVLVIAASIFYTNRRKSRG